MRGVILCLLFALSVACGGTETTDTFTNNGATNNGATNNGDSTNNGVVPAARRVSNILVEPSPISLRLNQTQAIEATALNAAGEAIPGTTFDFTSSDSAVAEVTAEGVVIARSTGAATVMVSAGTLTTTVAVEVLGEAVVSIEVAPADPAPIAIGRTVRLVVSLYDRLNAPIEDPREINFASDDESVVTVASDGAVTGVGAGQATVTVESEGVEVDVPFTVEPPELVDVELDVPQTTLVPGDTAAMTLTLRWRDDVAPAQLPAVSWSIDKPDVARIDAATGVVTAVAKGTASITATVSGVDYLFANAIEVVFAFGSVTAGGAHACGLVRGVAFCWGANDAGQLGRASGTAPGRVEFSRRFERLTAGGAHTCGLTAAGAAHCWGEGASGQLGNGADLASATAVAVSGNHVFASIAAGVSQTCGVTDTGSLYCWGGASSNTPQLVGSFVDVTVNDGHTCAIDASDTAYCWGQNDAGQLGLNNTDPATTPQPVSGGYEFADIVAGAAHTCGQSTSGATLCWGANDLGQVGDGSGAPRLTPMLISAAALSRLTAGRDHTCALTTNGEARCWGLGADGRLGTGSDTNAMVPTAVTGAGTYFSIDAGDVFTCAVSTAAEVHCWGAGAAGQLGVASLGSDVPVVVSGFITP